MNTLSSVSKKSGAVQAEIEIPAAASQFGGDSGIALSESHLCTASSRFHYDDQWRIRYGRVNDLVYVIAKVSENRRGFSSFESSQRRCLLLRKQGGKQAEVRPDIVVARLAPTNAIQSPLSAYAQAFAGLFINKADQLFAVQFHHARFYSIWSLRRHRCLLSLACCYYTSPVNLLLRAGPKMRG